MSSICSIFFFFAETPVSYTLDVRYNVIQTVRVCLYFYEYVCVFTVHLNVPWLIGNMILCEWLYWHKLNILKSSKWNIFKIFHFDKLKNYFHTSLKKSISLSLNFFLSKLKRLNYSITKFFFCHYVHTAWSWTSLNKWEWSLYIN